MIFNVFLSFSKRSSSISILDGTRMESLNSNYKTTLMESVLTSRRRSKKTKSRVVFVTKNSKDVLSSNSAAKSPFV